MPVNQVNKKPDEWHAMVLLQQEVASQEKQKQLELKRSRRQQFHDEFLKNQQQKSHLQKTVKQQKDLELVQQQLQQEQHQQEMSKQKQERQKRLRQQNRDNENSIYQTVQQSKQLQLTEQLKEKVITENNAQQEIVEKHRQKSKNLNYGNILKNELLSKQQIKKQSNEIKSLNQEYDMQAIREFGEQEIKRQNEYKNIFVKKDQEMAIRNEEHYQTVVRPQSIAMEMLLKREQQIADLHQAKLDLAQEQRHETQQNERLRTRNQQLEQIQEKRLLTNHYEKTRNEEESKQKRIQQEYEKTMKVQAKNFNQRNKQHYREELDRQRQQKRGMELRSSMNEAEIKMNSQDLDAYLKKEKIKSLVPGIKSHFTHTTTKEERSKLDFYNEQKASSQLSMLPQISGKVSTNTTKMGIDQLRKYSSTIEKQKPITISAPENLPLQLPFRNANHQSSAEVLPEYASVLDFGTPSRHPTKLDNYNQTLNHKYANSLRKTNATEPPTTNQSMANFRKPVGPQQADDGKYEANLQTQNEDYKIYQAQPESNMSSPFKKQNIFKEKHYSVPAATPPTRELSGQNAQYVEQQYYLINKNTNNGNESPLQGAGRLDMDYQFSNTLGYQKSFDSRQQNNRVQVPLGSPAVRQLNQDKALTLEATGDHMRNLSLQNPHRTNARMREMKNSFAQDIGTLAGNFRGNKGHAGKESTHTQSPLKGNFIKNSQSPHNQRLNQQMLITDQESSQPKKTFGHVVKPEVTFQSARDRFQQSGRQRINYGAHQPRFGSFAADNQSDNQQRNNFIGAPAEHPISYGNPYEFRQ